MGEDNEATRKRQVGVRRLTFAIIPAPIVGSSEMNSVIIPRSAYRPASSEGVATVGIAGSACRVLLLVALVAAGCGSGDKEARARAVAEGYLQAVKERDPDKAMAFFAKAYLEARSPAGWRADLRLITTRLGALQSYSLKSWTWRTDLVPPDSGTHVTLQYEVRYAKHTATETLVVFKPFARGEYKIVGHTIASKGLM